MFILNQPYKLSRCNMILSNIYRKSHTCILNYLNAMWIMNLTKHRNSWTEAKDLVIFSLIGVLKIYLNLYIDLSLAYAVLIKLSTWNKKDKFWSIVTPRLLHLFASAKDILFKNNVSCKLTLLYWVLVPPNNTLFFFCGFKCKGGQCRCYLNLY